MSKICDLSMPGTRICLLPELLTCQISDIDSTIVRTTNSHRDVVINKNLVEYPYVEMETSYTNLRKREYTPRLYLL